jgi:hypothetical protein
MFTINNTVHLTFDNRFSFEKPYIGVNGENLTQYIRVSPPYLLMAHSAGALYARQVQKL